MSQNNRLKLCFIYRIKGFVQPAVIYLAIFMFIDLVIPAALFLIFRQRVFGTGFNYGGQEALEYGRSLVSYPFLISTMIFLFVGAVASFRENFNFLLTMNVTRRNQYFSDLLMMLIAGGAALVCSFVMHVFENLVEAFVNRISIAQQFQNFLDGSAGVYLLESVSELLLTLTIFLFAYALGLAAGILSYRFGRNFTIPFWICFGTSFMTVPILIANVEWIRKLGSWFIGIGQSIQYLSFAVHLLFTGLFLVAIGGIFIRKLQQNN